LSGDNLSSHPPTPQMECLELGSPSSAQSPQQCAHMESLEGNRCHWAACERSFGTVIELRNHLRHHSSNQKRCLWSRCARVTQSTAALNKHLDSHIKPYHCPQSGCTRRAATTRDLRRHVQSHGRRMGSTIYYCPFENCIHGHTGSKLSFGRLDNAVRHLKRKHPGFLGNPVPRKFNGSDFL
jgi:hypothetical protein